MGGGKIIVMEKQPQDYRDNLADKLKEIRNSDAENPDLAKAEAKGYLNAKKETEEYKDSKAEHEQEEKRKYEAKEILAHGREWMMEFAKDKQACQEFFDLIDKMIEDGIFFRGQNEVMPFESYTSFSGTVLTTGLDGEDERGGVERKYFFSGDNGLFGECRKMFNEFDDISEKAGVEFWDGLVKKYPFVVRSHGIRPEFYEATGEAKIFQLGGSADLERLSSKYRNDPERIAKFRKFAEKFRKPQEVIQSESQEKEAREENRKALQAEIEAKKKELENL